MKRYALLFLTVLSAAMMTQGCATGEDLQHIDDQLSSIRADMRTAKVNIEGINLAVEAEARRGREIATSLDAIKSDQARLVGEVGSLRDELAVIKRNQADLGSKMFTMSGGEMTSISGRIEEIAHGAETTNAKLDSLRAALTQQMAAVEAALAGLKPGAGDEGAGGPKTFDGMSTARPPVAAVPAGDPIQMYQSSYLDYTKGDFDIAIAGFRAYLTAYPDTEYAGNAQYWIGESLYSLGRHKEALVEFGKVINGYPNSQKIPGAMLKTGYCYEKLGDSSAAKSAFESLVRKYPNTDPGRLAADKLKPVARGQVKGR